MMDCDDICLPDRLRAQVQFLDTNPHVGVLGCAMWVVGQDLTPLFQFNVPEEHARIVWNLFFGWSVAGPAIMVRRELMVAVNGYEEGRTICDDIDLLSRLIGRTRLANLSDILMLYRRHPLADSVKKKALQRKELAAIIKRMLDALGRSARGDRRPFPARAQGRKGLPPRRTRTAASRDDALIDSFVDAGWVEADERPLLQSAMSSELQRIKPRRRHFWKRLI